MLSFISVTGCPTQTKWLLFHFSWCPGRGLSDISAVLVKFHSVTHKTCLSSGLVWPFLWFKQIPNTAVWGYRCLELCFWTVSSQDINGTDESEMSSVMDDDFRFILRLTISHTNCAWENPCFPFGLNLPASAVWTAICQTKIIPFILLWSQTQHIRPCDRCCVSKDVMWVFQASVMTQSFLISGYRACG